MNHTMNRRQWLAAITGFGVSSLAPSALAQPSRDESNFDPRQAGEIHNKALQEISEALARSSGEIRDVMHRLIELLDRKGLFKGHPDDAKVLHQLADRFDPSVPFDKAAPEIERFCDEMIDKVGKTAASILSIARKSVEFVRTHQDQIVRGVYIVAADVSGALGGAVTGAKASAIFGPVAIPVGIAAGATAGSAGVWWKTREKKDKGKKR